MQLHVWVSGKLLVQELSWNGLLVGEKKVYGSLKFSAKLKGGEEMIP